MGNLDFSPSKLNAARVSVIASLFLAFAKLIIGLVSGSLALLSEAGHAMLDTGATLLTYFAIKAADRPADDNHPYGHGKIESLAALVETALLFLLACVVVWEAVDRLWLNPHLSPLSLNIWTFAVLLLSMGVDFIRWRSLTSIAKKTGSHALEADALHFSSDFMASGLILLALLAAYYGFPQADTYAAIGVAIFIAIAGWKLGSRTIEHLLDTIPKGLSQNMRHIIEQVEHVTYVQSLKLRPLGVHVIGEAEIAVPRTLPLEHMAHVKNEIREALRLEWPNTHMTISVNPQALEGESLLERVLVVAARRRLPVHHITIQDVEDHKSISLDLELESCMPLQEAHEIATGLEKALHEEIGNVEIETHIEPLEILEFHGVDAGPEIHQKIIHILAEKASQMPIALEPHHVRVRQTKEGYWIINYHCRLDPLLTVAKAHGIIDELDRFIRAHVPKAMRVVGHAEPFPKALP